MHTTTKKILIVDDHDHILELVTILLEEAGYEVIAANSFESALKQIEQTKPDMAILDYMLPERDGSELLQEIQLQPGLENLPIVFLTGLAVDHGDRPSQIKAFGKFYEALSKPIQNELLLQLVREKLSPEAENDPSKAS